MRTTPVISRRDPSRLLHGRAQLCRPNGTEQARAPVRAWVCVAWRAVLATLLIASTLPVSHAQPQPARAAAERMLRSADVHPEDYPTVQAVLHMNQLLNERTGGRLGIQVFHSAQLGDEELLARQVASGQLDMNRLNVQGLAQIAPEIGVLAMPFLFRDEDHLRKVIDGPIGASLLDGLQKHNLVGLAFYDAGIRSIYTREKPIAKLADLRGQTVRVQPSAISRRTFELLGATVVEIPFAHVGRAMSNKLVDGAENNVNSYASTTHYEYAPNFTLSAHSMAPEVLVMSRASWQKLSLADRRQVQLAATESVSMMRGMWVQRQERMEALLRLKGVQFITLDAAERARFESAVAPLYSSDLVAPAMRQLIARIRAVK